MSILFAATYPERVSHLILIGCFSRSADRLSDEAWNVRLDQIVKHWGSGEMLKTIAPSEAVKPATVAQFGRYERLASSPGALRTILQLNRQIDVTAILPTLQVPTLVLHSKADLQVPVELGRKIAAAVPGVKYVEYSTGDHAFWTGDTERTLGDIEEFVTGHRDHGADELERVPGDRAVHRHRRLHAQRRSNGRPALAPAARRSQSDRQGHRRQASWQSGEEHWRRVGRDLRRARPRGALCARLRLSREADRASRAGRPSHWRDRDPRQRYRRHRRCMRPRA